MITFRFDLMKERFCGARICLLSLSRLGRLPDFLGQPALFMRTNTPFYSEENIIRQPQDATSSFG